MSRLINFFNNLEYFESTDQESASENTIKIATDSDIQSTEGDVQSTDEDRKLTKEDVQSTEGDVQSTEEGEEIQGKQKNIGKGKIAENTEDSSNDEGENKIEESESEKLIKEIAKQDSSNMDFDEQDDEELEEDNVEDQANEMLEEDEIDDDDLTDEDIDTLINSKFVEKEKDDEVDPEVFVPPVIDLSKRNLDPGLDEKLTDMTIDDDDTDENLFKQGGANGERAEAYVSQVNDDGDELAQLIMEVPITIITTLLEIWMNITWTIIIGPFAEGLQNIFEPVRNVLVKIYSILTPLILLINNLINLPFSIGVLAWATICNLMKLFGASVSCNKKYKKNDFIKNIYDRLTDIDILRPADIIFQEEPKRKFISAVTEYVKIWIQALTLIMKIIPVILKMIEFIINIIKETISIMTEVTDGENLKNLGVIIVMLGICYISLFGMTSVVSIYQTIVEKFFS